MTDLSALKELRDKVEAGTPTTWRDFAIYDLIPHDKSAFRAFNGSLDAAKALHEAMLSEWGWSVSDTGDVALWPPGSIDEQNAGAIGVRVEMAPARAWLLAILDALIAKEGGEG